jgi:dinuclear metal center YbgI/SA1388 family protein
MAFHGLHFPLAAYVERLTTWHIMNRDTLTQWLDAEMQPERFKDYGPNGLQVQGRAQVRRIVSGVTASLALIDAAVEAQADAIVVHHGLFWRGQDGRLVGWLRERVARLLAHDISLYAYHLPLDAHPTLGNNAQWAQRMGWSVEGHFGDQQLGFVGRPAAPLPIEALIDAVQAQVQQPVRAVFSAQAAIKKIAWCTGGAQGYFEAAIATGADVFITGEMSEPQAHLARACGHHASERFGAQALARHAAQAWGLEHRFIEVPNPA